MTHHPDEHDAAQPRREPGRDGISGLVSPDRALRAREVSRPTPVDDAAARRELDALVARATRHRTR